MNNNELIIGAIPVLINNKINLICPKLENLCQNEETEECFITKKYKNKYILSSNFKDSENNNIYYKDLDDLIIKLDFTNNIYTNNKKHIIDCKKDLEEFLYKSLMPKLTRHYNRDKVNNIIEKILIDTENEFKNHSDFEDYDYYECFKRSINNIINLYLKDIESNFENIYIIQSIIYSDFIDLYYEFFSSNNPVDR